MKSRHIANDGFKVIVLIILLTLIRSANVHAQKSHIKFEHISLEQGLSQATVWAILQDRQGFMWFGTADGLNKFDGHNFTVYNYNPKTSTSLSDNRIFCLRESVDESIWIGTAGGGLNRFDRQKQEFTVFKYNSADPNSLSNNRVFTIYEDHEGVLWIGTIGGGLNKMIPPSSGGEAERHAIGEFSFERFHHDPEDSSSLSHNSVLGIMEDDAGNLWVGTADGLNYLNRHTGKFTRFKHDPQNPSSLSHSFVNVLFRDQSGALWVGTDGGLNKLKATSYSVSQNQRPSDLHREIEFERFQNDPNDQGSLSSNVVWSIFEDSAGSLWVGTDGGGINKLDPKSGTFVCYRNDAMNPHSLNNNRIRSIFEDRSGAFWIGTNGGGLNKFNRTRKKFVHYKHDPSKPQSLSANMTYAIYEDRNNTFWIGTFGGGLNKFDREKESFEAYGNDPANPTSLSDDRVLSIYQDRSGVLWIGTDDGGLNKLMLGKRPKFRRYQHDEANPSSITYNRVKTIFEDTAGRLWIGTYEGLNRFDRRTEKFVRYKHNPDDPMSLSNNRVMTIYEDKDGAVWVGTYGGLNKLVVVTADDPVASNGDSELAREQVRFVCFQNDPADSSSLSNNNVLSIYEDQTGVLWIGTFGGGLNRFQKESGKFTYFTQNDILPNNVVYGILGDDQGNLWLSTNKGISKFNPKTLDVKTYDVNDGLQSNEFNTGAYFRSQSGEMFFGGINGFNAFYPENIKDDPHKPQIVITDFQIFNKSVPISGTDARSPLQKSITETKEIVLSSKQSVFSLEFAALHYASPERNQYAYMMEGFDEDWVYSGNRRFATYTNLDPGDYVFRIKGSNKDGVWNEEGTSVKITITPPFWQTWWFRIVAGASVLALAFGWYKRRIRNIETQKKNLEIRVAEKTKEIRQAQAQMVQSEKMAALGQLIAGVAHEINTPLGAIRSSVGNIATSLDQVLHQLPDFYKGLSDEEQNLFIRLMDASLNGGQMLTSKEARQARRAMIRELEERGISNVDDIVDTFVDMGVVEQVESYLPLIQHEKGAEIIQMAYKLSGLQRGTQNINTASDRAAKVVFALKSYARHDLSAEKIRANIIDGIETVLTLYYNQFKHGVEVIRHFEEVKPILCYPDELNQVWTNIIHNALQAMDSKGTVTIDVRSEKDDIAVSVTDTGKGIPAQIKDKIFDPFFTTKPTGEGSGLGLDIVRRIIDKHYGQIEVDSEVGKGTTFTVRLPIES